MKKFSKTSYSRPSTQTHPHNINNFLHPSCEKPDRLHHRENKPKLMKKIPSNEQQLITSVNKPQHQTHFNQQPLHNLIQKKIQIDPSLLFAQKSHSRAQHRLEPSKKIKQKYDRNFSSTATEGFHQCSQQRPQSKQESRVKYGDGQKYKGVERPQTSKGGRNNREEEKGRKSTMEEEEEIKIQIKKSKHPQSACSSKRGSKHKQIELQTSIDPEFLALFAS